MGNSHKSLPQKTTLKLNGHIYSLTGVVLHTLLGNGVGHYTAFVRSRCDKTQWFYVNDAEVQILDDFCM